MAFPTIPTVGDGRVLTITQANTTGLRSFPSIGSLTKNPGDLIISIIAAYQTGLGTNAAFSSWTGGFTEFADAATTSSMAMGAAYKWSTGGEAGTPTVTQASVTGHAAMIMMSIPGADSSTPTPPEAGTCVTSTNATMPDPLAFNPSGWGTEDTLWIAVAGDGETSTSGTYTGIASPPSGYTDFVNTGTSADVVGGVQAAVAFLQVNAASENMGTFTADTSNARHAAFIIAVRPAALVDLARSHWLYQPRRRGNRINAVYY